MGHLPADILSEGLSDFVSLNGELLLEVLLLTAERLNLITVEVELLGQGFASLFEAVDLTLKGRVVRVSLSIAHVSGHSHLSDMIVKLLSKAMDGLLTSLLYFLFISFNKIWPNT